MSELLSRVWLPTKRFETVEHAYWEQLLKPVGGEVVMEFSGGAPLLRIGVDLFWPAGTSLRGDLLIWQSYGPKRAASRQLCDPLTVRPHLQNLRDRDDRASRALRRRHNREVGGNRSSIGST